MTEKQLPHEAGLFADRVQRVLDEVRDMLVQKNKAYGNSALSPVRVFSKADRVEQLRVRIDDKLSRIRNKDTSEDARLDLIGYLVLEQLAMQDYEAGGVTVAQPDHWVDEVARAIDAKVAKDLPRNFFFPAPWERRVAEDGVNPKKVKVYPQPQQTYGN